MERLYLSEIEQYRFDQQQSATDLKLLRPLLIQKKVKIYEKPMKNSKIVNLHSFFIDYNEITQKNSHFSMMLSNNREKIRFNLNFLYCLLLQRLKLTNFTEMYKNDHKMRKSKIFIENPNFLQSYEFSKNIDEILCFLEILPMNPYSFILSSFDFFFESWERVLGDGIRGISVELLKGLLSDYSLFDFEKQAYFLNILYYIYIFILIIGFIGNRRI